MRHPVGFGGRQRLKEPRPDGRTFWPGHCTRRTGCEGIERGGELIVRILVAAPAIAVGVVDVCAREPVRLAIKEKIGAVSSDKRVAAGGSRWQDAPYLGRPEDQDSPDQGGERPPPHLHGAGSAVAAQASRPSSWDPRDAEVAAT